MRVYADLVKKVSPLYKGRIREIISVLDPSLDYKIQVVKTIALMKERVRSLLSDSNGYTFVEGSTTVLSGNVVMYPHIKISGDLVIILVKNRMMGNGPEDVVSSNVILVYEKTESLADKLGGVIDC